MSAQAGMGKSTSSGKMPKVMRDIIQQAWGQISPLTETFTGQMQEALTTGGVGAQLPIIQRSEEAQRRAYAQSMQDMETQFAQSGLAGTPFAASERAALQTEGRTAVANIGPSIAAQFISGIGQFLTGQTGATMGAIPGTRQSKADAKNWQAAGGMGA